MWRSAWCLALPFVLLLRHPKWTLLPPAQSRRFLPLFLTSSLGPLDWFELGIMFIPSTTSAGAAVSLATAANKLAERAEASMTTETLKEAGTYFEVVKPYVWGLGERSSPSSVRECLPAGLF